MPSVDTAEPQAIFRDDAGTLAVALAGSWSADRAPRLEKLVGEIAGRLQHGARARLDLSDVSRLDTLGAYVLNRLKARQERDGASIEIVSSRPEHGILLAEVQIHDEDKPRSPDHFSVVSVLANIGEAVVRSLLTLRALTHRDTGGIIAAPTTSLPEQFGGGRNWDYRFVWLRDASLTIEVLLGQGFVHVVEHWQRWLLRAIAGDPADLQIVYGIAGERDLAERELESLPGYRGAAPVRIGNGAAGQYQADVTGEVMTCLFAARQAGIEQSDISWPLERALLRRAEKRIDEPDNGIWEIRGDPQLFTHSRAMVWAAFDRGVRSVREFGLDGPDERWERLRDRVRADIDRRGVSARGHLVQHAGTDAVDASLLLLPVVGFCAADDPRMLATVAEIERTLMVDGLVLRYRTESGVDGLEGTENPFLACSFWLVEQYAASGRLDDARALMDRACSRANDVGLLSEEYDVAGRRQAGNTPQALSHLALVRAASALARAEAAHGDAPDRAGA